MIVRDYVIKEVLRTFVGVFIVLFLIILSTQLLRSLASVAEGKIAIDFLFSLIFLKNIESLTLIIPLTLFLAIILALSRLYKDSEMIAFSACGIGPASLLTSIMFVIFSFIFIELAFALFIGPWANYQLQYAEETFKKQVDIELIAAGQFNLTKDGKRVLYAEDMPQPTQLNKVFLHIDNKKSQSVLASEDASIISNSKQGGRYIIFRNGNRYDGMPGSLKYRHIKFSDYGVLLEGKSRGNFSPDKESTPSADLFMSETLISKVELQWRISQILMLVILAMIAVPLSKTAPRQGRYGKMFIAILLYIVYSNLLVIAMNWLRNGVMPPAIGVWWVHILFFLVFLILFSRQMGWFSILIYKQRQNVVSPGEFDELVDH